jgi:hypothetical protein
VTPNQRRISSRINAEEHELQKTIKEGHGKSFEKRKMRIDLRSLWIKNQSNVNFQMANRFLTLRGRVRGDF